MVDRKMDDEELIDQIIDYMLPEARSAIRMKDPRTIIELQIDIKLCIANHQYTKPPAEPQRVNRTLDGSSKTESV